MVSQRWSVACSLVARGTMLCCSAPFPCYIAVRKRRQAGNQRAGRGSDPKMPAEYCFACTYTERYTEAHVVDSRILLGCPPAPRPHPPPSVSRVHLVSVPLRSHLTVEFTQTCAIPMTYKTKVVNVPHTQSEKHPQRAHAVCHLMSTFCTHCRSDPPFCKDVAGGCRRCAFAARVCARV